MLLLNRKYLHYHIFFFFQVILSFYLDSKKNLRFLMFIEKDHDSEGHCDCLGCKDFRQLGSESRGEFYDKVDNVTK